MFLKKESFLFLKAIKIHKHGSILLALVTLINRVGATTGPENDFQSASIPNFSVN
jgi:hypothetical protein